MMQAQVALSVPVQGANLCLGRLGDLTDTLTASGISMREVPIAKGTTVELALAEGRQSNLVEMTKSGPDQRRKPVGSNPRENGGCTTGLIVREQRKDTN